VPVMTVVDLHVRETGSGLPVVLLHAFPLSSAMWLEQRNDLGDAFRIITPDLRGFGGSQLGYDEPSLDHVADDVAALLDTLALDRVVLGGLSMGGYAAMAFLRRHGDRWTSRARPKSCSTTSSPP
jgi:pimeloyl-ACP methyl ester carboxylesterase